MDVVRARVVRVEQRLALPRWGSPERDGVRRAPGGTQPREPLLQLAGEAFQSVKIDGEVFHQWIVPFCPGHDAERVNTTYPCSRVLAHGSSGVRNRDQLHMAVLRDSPAWKSSCAPLRAWPIEFKIAWRSAADLSHSACRMSY